MAVYHQAQATNRPTFPLVDHRLPRKIALEEAIGTDVFNATATFPPHNDTSELPYVESQYAADVKDRLFDIEKRIEAMDRAGVDLAIVSLAMPGMKGIYNSADAIKMAKQVNDEIYAKYLTGQYAHRFKAFACVPVQNPAAAASELERCVRELGCVGALVNGFVNKGSANEVQYLDDDSFEPLWSKLEELDAPLYLHPRIPSPSQMRAYEGYKFIAGSPWGFGVETATHALRLMLCGLFDRYPRLKIILGHCSEGLPFSLYRVDHRLRHFRPENERCKLPLQHYWMRNFWVTTAGVMSSSALSQTIQLCGEEQVMWSAEYPFEDYDEAAGWYDGLEMNVDTKMNIGWRNAEKLFKLKRS